MTEYALSEDSFMCDVGGHAVFLDLKKNRYVALPFGDSERLRRLIPSVRSHQESVDIAVDVDQQSLSGLACMLKKEGLIVERRSSLTPFRNPASELAESTFLDAADYWDNLQVKDIRRLLFARMRVAWMLRAFSLRAIVHKIRRRKNAIETDDVFPMDEARLLTRTFFLCESLLGLGDGNCIQRSFTLLEFLAQYRLYPLWVFGVRVQPFSAICWIQHGSVVFNESLRHVRACSPIMSV